MGFAYGILSIDGAILAGLILLSAHQYIRLGRFGRVDMTLTFFEALALFAFWWWFQRRPATAAGGRGGLMLYVAAGGPGCARYRFELVYYPLYRWQFRRFGWC